MFKGVLILITFLLPASALSEEQVRVTDLGWLTGSWDGQMGPAVLEENWSLPRAGTIASLVRQTGPDGMGMVFASMPGCARASWRDSRPETL